MGKWWFYQWIWWDIYQWSFAAKNHPAKWWFSASDHVRLTSPCEARPCFEVVLLVVLCPVFAGSQSIEPNPGSLVTSKTGLKCNPSKIKGFDSKSQQHHSSRWDETCLISATLPVSHFLLMILPFLWEAWSIHAWTNPLIVGSSQMNGFMKSMVTHSPKNDSKTSRLFFTGKKLPYKIRSILTHRTLFGCLQKPWICRFILYFSYPQLFLVKIPMFDPDKLVG